MVLLNIKSPFLVSSSVTIKELLQKDETTSEGQDEGEASSEPHLSARLDSSKQVQ